MKIIVRHNSKQSGFRFLSLLQAETTLDEPYVLYNVNAPLSVIIRNKICLNKVIIRFDGIYFDKYRPEYIKSRILRYLIGVLNAKFNIDWFYNMLTMNYKLMVKYILADAVIFQSNFSKDLWFKIFWKKRSVIIRNGFTFNEVDIREKTHDIVVHYQRLRKNKLGDDTLRAIHLIIERLPNYHIYLLGNPNSEILKNSRNISIIESFDTISEIAHIYKKAKFCLFLSYRDACPNALIECMSFNVLPLVIPSGGIPEIIPKNWPVLDFNDSSNFYVDFRFKYPEIDIDLYSIFTIISKFEGEFKLWFDLLRIHFQNELDITKVAEKYNTALGEFTEGR